MYDINKGQLRLDMVLKTERTIAENIQTAIEFTMEQLIQGDPPPSAVHDRHAAYGVAAQNYVKAAASLRKSRAIWTRCLIRWTTSTTRHRVWWTHCAARLKGPP